MEPASTIRAAILTRDQRALSILAHAEEMLAKFGVAYDVRVIDEGKDVRDAIEEMSRRGARVIVVANTRVPVLSAQVAAVTKLPVLAVPVDTPEVGALAILQASADSSGAMCLAIGKAGAINAALLAVAILANSDVSLREKLVAFRREQTAAVLADRLD
jgi:5-(carboxyamino)imidazole ribonucleotide mutase